MGFSYGSTMDAVAGSTWRNLSVKHQVTLPAGAAGAEGRMVGPYVLLDLTGQATAATAATAATGSLGNPWRKSTGKIWRFIGRLGTLI